MAQSDLRKARTAARAVQRAERNLGEAILRASEAGESYKDIAPFVGLSPSRTHQLAQEARARREQE